MKRAVIIGAGPAGITAALELKKSGQEFEVIVLEETDTVGGISRTVKYNGKRMDIGGHRFFSKDQRVMKWWQEMMPVQGALPKDDRTLGRVSKTVPGGPDPEKENRVMLVRNRVSRIYYQKHFFDYPVSLKWDTLKNMGFITTMKAGFSYLGSLVHKRPEDSLENFYVNRFGKVLYSMFFEGYTEKLWGRHPREISADWGAQRVKGLSVKAVLKDMFSKLFPGKKEGKQVETSLIEEFYYPKLGPGQLWETAAREAEKLGCEFRMGCRVKKIHTEQGRVTAVTYEKDGREERLSGDVFLSSMPVKDLVAGMDQVPAAQAEIAAGLPYRDFVTVGLLVDRLNLKNETKIPTLGNIVPDCWIYVQDVHVKLGRIQIFNNWSPYMLPDPEKHVWIGLEYFCREGDEYWNMGQEAWVKFASEELVKMGVLEQASMVEDAHMERVKKAYPAYFDTYARMDELTEWLDGFENLYCIGRNGQHRYNNMDHSMATAFEAVKNITAGRKDKSNVWSVNTEKTYHEEQKQ